MSKERFVERLAERVSRRPFLVKVGTGAVGGLLALMGLPQRADAYWWNCCNLCYAPGGDCSSCSCTWCWTCNDGSTSYRCCECYDEGSPYCDGEHCERVVCSYGYQL